MLSEQNSINIYQIYLKHKQILFLFWYLILGISFEIILFQN